MSEQPETPKTYSTAETAERLGVSVFWVRNRCADGSIPHVRIARRYRFTDEHIAEIIRLHSREVQPPIPPPAKTPRRPVTVTKPRAEWKPQP